MLGGNQFKKDSNRLVWNAASTRNEIVGQEKWDERAIIPAVQLKPMEIRTFIITLVRI
jgi:lysosomal alpha-mannosidase